MNVHVRMLCFQIYLPLRSISRSFNAFVNCGDSIIISADILMIVLFQSLQPCSLLVHSRQFTDKQITSTMIGIYCVAPCDVRILKFCFVDSAVVVNAPLNSRKYTEGSPRLLECMRGLGTNACSKPFGGVASTVL